MVRYRGLDVVMRRNESGWYAQFRFDGVEKITGFRPSAEKAYQDAYREVDKYLAYEADQFWKSLQRTGVVGPKMTG